MQNIIYLPNIEYRKNYRVLKKFGKIRKDQECKSILTENYTNKGILKGRNKRGLFL